MEPGDRIGYLRIVEQLGEGGMGAVFRAADERLEREVAVKALHASHTDSELRSRLLLEARVLSQLRHPNVCQIYDYLEGDESDYLVLELIEGRTLRQVLAQGGLERPRALGIAEQIARALAATHARGVVHRDLKLSNVMLTDDGEVKILDFGLSRATAATSPGRDREATARATATYDKTELGQVLGTAGAMSPEQARGERITAASDMYSFGLLLQELFTGEAPFEPDLSPGVLLVRSAEGDTRPVRGLDADLTRLVEALKALAPEDRPTAAEAAARLRHVRDRPRRRMRLLAAAALCLVAVLAVVKYTLDLRRERNLAVAARREAEVARAGAEEVSGFLVGLFEVSDPGEARGNTITARELLDRGAEQARGELQSQPLTQARLMDSIGRIYHQLGLYAAAEPLLVEALAVRERLLPADSPELATSLHGLAVLRRDQGQRAEAEPLLARALAIRERALGPDHPEVAESLNELAVTYGYLGRLADALPLFERVVAIRERALGSDDPALAAALNNVGIVYGYQGKTAEAEPYFLRGLAIRERVLPPDHPDLAANLVALGTLYGNDGRDEESLVYFRRGLEIWEKTLGPDHPRLGLLLTNIGNTLLTLGDAAGAEAAYRRAVALRERALGPGHPDVAFSLAGLGDVSRHRRDLAVAERYYRRVLEIRERALPPGHRDLVQAVEKLAALLAETGRADEGAALTARLAGSSDATLQGSR